MNSDRDVRVSGIVLLVIGGVLCAWQIIWPIFQALSGNPEIGYYEELAVMGWMAFLLGLVMAVFGERAGKMKPTNLNIVLVLAVVFALILGCLFGQQAIFRYLGYS
jgi:hypothetical protein